MEKANAAKADMDVGFDLSRSLRTTARAGSVLQRLVAHAAAAWGAGDAIGGQAADARHAGARLRCQMDVQRP